MTKKDRLLAVNNSPKWTDTRTSGKSNMYMYWQHTNKKQTNNKSHSDDGNINLKQFAKSTGKLWNDL